MKNDAKYLKMNDIINRVFHLTWYGFKDTQYGKSLFFTGYFSYDIPGLINKNEKFLICTQSQKLFDAFSLISQEDLSTIPQISILKQYKVNSIGQPYTLYELHFETFCNSYKGLVTMPEPDEPEPEELPFT